MAIARLAELGRMIVPIAPVEVAAAGASAQPIDQRWPAITASAAASLGARRSIAAFGARRRRCRARPTASFAGAIVAHSRQRRAIGSGAPVGAIHGRSAADGCQTEHRQPRGDASLNQHPSPPFAAPPAANGGSSSSIDEAERGRLAEVDKIARIGVACQALPLAPPHTTHRKEPCEHRPCPLPLPSAP